jgi:hypothetical protein
VRALLDDVSSVSAAVRPVDDAVEAVREDDALEMTVVSVTDVVERNSVVAVDSESKWLASSSLPSPDTVVIDCELPVLELTLLTDGVLRMEPVEERVRSAQDSTGQHRTAQHTDVTHTLTLHTH